MPKKSSFRDIREKVPTLVSLTSPPSDRCHGENGQTALTPTRRGRQVMPFSCAFSQRQYHPQLRRYSACRRRYIRDFNELYVIIHFADHNAYRGTLSSRLVSVERNITRNAPERSEYRVKFYTIAFRNCIQDKL